MQTLLNLQDCYCSKIFSLPPSYQKIMTKKKGPKWGRGLMRIQQALRLNVIYKNSRLKSSSLVSCSFIFDFCTIAKGILYRLENSCNHCMVRFGVFSSICNATNTGWVVFLSLFKVTITRDSSGRIHCGRGLFLTNHRHSNCWQGSMGRKWYIPQPEEVQCLHWSDFPLGCRASPSSRWPSQQAVQGWHWRFSFCIFEAYLLPYAMEMTSQ